MPIALSEWKVLQKKLELLLDEITQGQRMQWLRSESRDVSIGDLASFERR